MNDPRNAEKVFCIGMNKTGTTSLEGALMDLGFRLGNQHHGELLLKPYLARNFDPIIDFCTTADAFQDIPFSLPFTYILLDHHFRNAKFILSVRDSPEQWYKSVTKFSPSMFPGSQGLPTIEMLKASRYAYPGFLWDAQRVVGPAVEIDPYDREAHVRYYNSHNDSVRTYFEGKTNMLEINLSRFEDYHRTCLFLGRSPVRDRFPWLNRS